MSNTYKQDIDASFLAALQDKFLSSGTARPPNEIVDEADNFVGLALKSMLAWFSVVENASDVPKIKAGNMKRLDELADRDSTAIMKIIMDHAYDLLTHVVLDYGTFSDTHYFIFFDEFETSENIKVNCYLSNELLSQPGNHGKLAIHMAPYCYKSLKMGRSSVFTRIADQSSLRYKSISYKGPGDNSSKSTSMKHFMFPKSFYLIDDPVIAKSMSVDLSEMISEMAIARDNKDKSGRGKAAKFSSQKMSTFFA